MRGPTLVLAALLAAAPHVHTPVHAQEDYPSGAVLMGYVVDQATRQRVAGAAVEFPELERRVITDVDGRFAVVGMPRGRHAVRVRQIGYDTYEQTVEITRDQHTLTIALGPRPVVLEGITAHGYTFGEQLRERRRRVTASSRANERDRLALTGARDAVEVVLQEALLSRASCGGGMFGRDLCVWSRGRAVRPSVYIDDRPAMGLEELEMYRPAELYAIEVYRGGQHIRAYTTWWVESQGRRNRRVLQPIFIW